MEEYHHSVVAKYEDIKESVVNDILVLFSFLLSNWFILVSVLC